VKTFVFEAFTPEGELVGSGAVDAETIDEALAEVRRDLSAVSEVPEIWILVNLGDPKQMQACAKILVEEGDLPGRDAPRSGAPDRPAFLVNPPRN